MNNENSSLTGSEFDPYEKERELKSESDSWDVSHPQEAIEGDIPVINVEDYFLTDSEEALEDVATQLRIACEEVGFFTLIGHQVSSEALDAIFEQTREFHSLPLKEKNTVLMDRPDWPTGGMGYLPVKNRKLPARDKGNLNEAFIVKRDHSLKMDDNQWPSSELLPEFRGTVEAYADKLSQLGKQLLPVFARALEMPKGYFNSAFETPQYRLRMTHYPVMQERLDDEFGIAPHVDTTFCTILAQDQPGLTIFSERRKQWIKAPMMENAFIVNSGELLRHWTNDRFLSVKHFANNNVGAISRYSVPFFFNANSNYTMTCIPTCCSPDNPAKYAPISYAESQAVVQGE